MPAIVHPFVHVHAFDDGRRTFLGAHEIERGEAQQAEEDGPGDDLANRNLDRLNCSRAVGGVSHDNLLGTPRPVKNKTRRDGRSPGSRILAWHRPSRIASKGFPVVSRPQSRYGARHSAYSCGGSHGFGPFWVVRTVFPINPLDFIRRGTIADNYRNSGRAGSMSVAPCFVAFRPSKA